MRKKNSEDFENLQGLYEIDLSLLAAVLKPLESLGTLPGLDVVRIDVPFDGQPFVLTKQIIPGQEQLLTGSLEELVRISEPTIMPCEFAVSNQVLVFNLKLSFELREVHFFHKVLHPLQQGFEPWLIDRFTPLPIIISVKKGFKERKRKRLLLFYESRLHTVSSGLRIAFIKVKYI